MLGHSASLDRETGEMNSRCSMYGIVTCIWVIYMANGASGNWMDPFVAPTLIPCYEGWYMDSNQPADCVISGYQIKILTTIIDPLYRSKYLLAISWRVVCIVAMDPQGELLIYLAIQWCGRSDQRIVWRIHISNRYIPYEKRGAGHGATNSASQPSNS